MNSVSTHSFATILVLSKVRIILKSLLNNDTYIICTEKNIIKHNTTESFFYLDLTNYLFDIVICQKLKRSITDFNLFPSIPPTTDQYELKAQKISTRLFVILLVLIMTILLLYTSLIQVTKKVTVNEPTFEKYAELYDRYSQILSCPCSKISINYGNVLEIHYSFHQVCTSSFIDDDWIDSLTIDYENTVLKIIDFRWTAKQFFQILRSFCKLTNNTISYSLNQFYTKQFVTVSAVPFQVFQSQSRSAVDQFILSTTNSFLISLNKIRTTTHVNSLFSAHMTNYEPIVDPTYDDVLFIQRKYDNCSCGLSFQCSVPSSVYDFENDTILFTVPGMYVGCYAIEALLQSTLECLYNQYCIDTIHRYHRENDSVQGTPLQQSNTTIYSKNSTVQDLVDQLMIDTWDSSIMYNRYYNECQPIQCTYSYKTRNDLILIITALVGLVGGLTTSLKIVVPRLVKMIRKRKPGKTFHTSA